MKEDPADPKHDRFVAQLRRMNAETERFVAEQRAQEGSKSPVTALLTGAALFTLGAVIGAAMVRLAGW